MSEGEFGDTAVRACWVLAVHEIGLAVSDSIVGERSLGRLSSEQHDFVFRVERTKVFLLEDLVFYDFNEKKGKRVNPRTR
jgi:hypothetical protein